MNQKKKYMQHLNMLGCSFKNGSNLWIEQKAENNCNLFGREAVAKGLNEMSK
jgi:hypothetical protein